MTQAEFERMLRGVFNEGTAQGQKSWAGTNQATLRSIQHVMNMLMEQVIPKLPGAKGSDGVARSADVTESSDLDETTEEVTPDDVLAAFDELSRKLSPEQAKVLGSLLASRSSRKGQEKKMK